MQGVHATTVTEMTAGGNSPRGSTRIDQRIDPRNKTGPHLGSGAPKTQVESGFT
jgi:hypothetical protein